MPPFHVKIARSLAKPLHRATQKQECAVCDCSKPSASVLSEDLARDFTIQYTNRQFDRMFGYDTGELIGRHMDVRNGDAEPSAEVIRSRLTQAIRASGPDGFKLSQQKGLVTLVIADDGCGFKKASRHQKPGLGLQIMEHRARMVGANLHIESGAAGGTVVTCTYPNRRQPASRRS